MRLTTMAALALASASAIGLGLVQAPSSAQAEVTTQAAQRVSYNVTCNGKPLTVWADFERSGTARRGVRGGFSRTDWTLTFGRLGVVSSGAGKVTDVRFSSPVIAGSGYSQGAVGTVSNTWVQVVPWPWGATTIGQACNGGLGWTIPAPQ